MHGTAGAATSITGGGDLILDDTAAATSGSESSFVQAALLPAYLHASQEPVEVAYAGTALVASRTAETVVHVIPPPKPTPAPVLTPAPSPVVIAVTPKPAPSTPAARPHTTAPKKIAKPIAVAAHKPAAKKSAPKVAAAEAAPSDIKIHWGGPVKPSQMGYGQCTMWVVKKRGGISWFGNANQWPANARKAGLPTGNTPVKGAILVTNEGYVGHVAFVEEVFADGSFKISEMNYNAWNTVDYRTLKANAAQIVTFIY